MPSPLPAATAVSEQPRSCPYTIRNLWFHYPASHPALHRAVPWVIQDLSLDVRSGEILGVLGPNGSGKSSLVKILAGLLRPQRGTIQMFGADLSQLTPRDRARRIAVVFQDAPITFPMTIRELVLRGRYPHRSETGLFSGWGWESVQDHEIVRQSMDEVEIAHLADRPLHSISAGERQRAYLARALAQRTPVLILDEPTAYLDVHHQVACFRILHRLQLARKQTIVIVTHDLHLAGHLCDRILLLSHGLTAALGPPHEVLQADRLESVFHCRVRVLVEPHPLTARPMVTAYPDLRMETGSQSPP